MRIWFAPAAIGLTPRARMPQSGARERSIERRQGLACSATAAAVSVVRSLDTGIERRSTTGVIGAPVAAGSRPRGLERSLREPACHARSGTSSVTCPTDWRSSPHALAFQSQAGRPDGDCSSQRRERSAAPDAVDRFSSPIEGARHRGNTPANRSRARDPDAGDRGAELESSQTASPCARTSRRASAKAPCRRVQIAVAASGAPR